MVKIPEDSGRRGIGLYVTGFNFYKCALSFLTGNLPSHQLAHKIFARIHSRYCERTCQLKTEFGKKHHRGEISDPCGACFVSSARAGS